MNSFFWMTLRAGERKRALYFNNSLETADYFILLLISYLSDSLVQLIILYDLLRPSLPFGITRSDPAHTHKKNPKQNEVNSSSSRVNITHIQGNINLNHLFIESCVDLLQCHFPSSNVLIPYKLFCDQGHELQNKQPT